MPVMTMHHQWMKMTMMDVDTIPDLDEPDKVVVIEDPERARQAEEDAVFGCKVCGVILAGNADTLCEGPEDD